MKRLMCLFLPNWPVQRLLAERPELLAGPVVLHRRDPRRGERVVAVCGRARSAGVRLGASLAEALGLVPTAAARPYDPAADLAGLGRLAEHCEQFSPRVGWETGGGVVRSWGGEKRSSPPHHLTTPPPYHLFLDVTGVSQLFGGEDALAGQVAASCREVGYAGRVAIAGTLGAAWAVASLAAVDHGGINIVPPAELLAILRPLPVMVLRLPADTVDLLCRLGVESINDLLRLPRAGLASRFGPQLTLRLDQALGTAPEMLIPHRPLPVFEAAVRFDFPTDRSDVLDEVFGGLIDRVATELQARGRGAIHLIGEFGCGSERVMIDVGLYRPTDLAKPMRELVRLHCERLALPGPVDWVRICADQTISLRPRQARLFPDPSAAIEGPLAELLERLSSRLGSAVVLKPVLQADPLPERAVRFVPALRAVSGQRSAVSRQRATGSKRKQALLPAARCLLPAATDRPLRLLARPAPVAVIAEPAGSPAAFHWQERQTVARWWGPERIETGWWRRGIVRRDYYRVETAVGRRFWLFRDLVNGEWFLHGSFE